MHNFMFGIVAISILLAAEDAFSACSWSGGTPSPLVRNIIVPSKMAINAVAIGDELARHTTDLWIGPISSQCPGVTTLDISLQTGLLPSSQAYIYETGIKGIGVKFCMRTSPTGGTTRCLPHSRQIDNGYGPFVSQDISVIFIRTGRDVASGKFSLKFKSDWKHVEHTLTVTSDSTVELINDVMFAGCESIGGAVNVPMGKQTIQNISKGSVKEVPFTFDVRCTGLAANTSVPVKVYFEGSSPGDGLLNLTNQGQAGVASGVGISVVNDKGIKLPFDIARSIKLDWNRSTPDGEIYRFVGSAKYVPTTGTMTAGRGDGTMNFVLNYN
ncbi:fimbrial protein [Pseudomonas sp. MRSN 12121]|nr:fimbrial protein [Pseudomonas sp. MRSN 12121]